MILYRVMLQGVAVMETHDAALAHEVATAAQASVVAVHRTPDAYNRSYVRRLWWVIAVAVACYVAAVATGHW